MNRKPTKKQSDILDRIAELLQDKPETADRATEYLKEMSGFEVLASTIKRDRFYKPAEVIKILSISRNQLYVLIKANKIKTVKVGTYQKIIGQDLINFIKGEYEI